MDGEKKACVESGASHGAISKFEFVIDSATLCKVGRTDGRRSVRAPQDKKAGGSAGLEDLFLAAMRQRFSPAIWKNQNGMD